MSDKLRIAVLSPCGSPCHRRATGGIELVVSLLADGLAEAGHEVTLFASGESLTKAKLSYIFEEAPSELIGAHAAGDAPRLRLLHARGRVRRDQRPLGDSRSRARRPARDSGPAHGARAARHPEAQHAYESIAKVSPSVELISISEEPAAPDARPAVGGDDSERDRPLALPVQAAPGEYLLFLGRISPDKGAHRAIAVAMELGLPLKMAGKNREPKERQYFAEFVEPHLGNGIEYLGEVTHGEKVELLQDARATLFPIEWEEPFGLVMIESMACGTPVIATRHGAVPEVIDDGRSGIIVEEHREMLRRSAGGRARPDGVPGDTSRNASRRNGWCATTWTPTQPH